MSCRLNFTSFNAIATALRPKFILPWLCSYSASMEEEEALLIDRTEGCTEFFVNVVQEQSGKEASNYAWTRRCCLCNTIFKGGIGVGKQACHVGWFKAKGVTIGFCTGAGWTDEHKNKARQLSKAGKLVLAQEIENEKAEIARQLLVQQILEQRHAADAEDGGDCNDRRCSPRLASRSTGSSSLVPVPPPNFSSGRKRQRQQLLVEAMESPRDHFDMLWARACYHQGNLAASFCENPYFVEYTKQLAAAEPFDYAPPKRTKWVLLRAFSLLRACSLPIVAGSPPPC
jgi:hypothetical protein